MPIVTPRGGKVLERMVQQNAENSWVGWFRFVTPILVTIALFMISNIQHQNEASHKEIMNKVDSIDDKLFKHLTNDEMHCPRTLTMSKAEFSIYQEMRQKQMDDLRNLFTQRIDGMNGILQKLVDMMERKR